MKPKRPGAERLKELPHHDRLERILYGAASVAVEGEACAVREHRLAHQITLAVQIALKAKHDGVKLKVFRKLKVGSHADIFRATMVDCFDLLLACAVKKEAEPLRVLAERIETVSRGPALDDPSLCRFLMQQLAFDQFTNAQVFIGTRKEFRALVREKWRRLGRNTARFDTMAEQFKRFERQLGMKFKDRKIRDS